MLTGRNPLDGELLGLNSAPGREPVPGFDLTFSAPKSVSLTWALGGHPVSSQVAEAHRAAVAEALKYLEASACWARRGRGGAEFVRGAGFIAAAYPHRSSRAGDPQLHTHVLIANATLGPDGRWSRLYHPALYEHAKTASYIYEAHLRHELTRRLGVEWQPVRKGIADIKGFTDEQIRRFSTRRQEILEAAGEGASARAMQIATLATRSAKEHDLTDATLRETWRVKALEVGLDREEIAGFLGHEQPRHKLLTVREVERSVTAHASHFDRRDAIQAVADNLPHGAPGHEVEQLADALLAAESVIQISEGPRGPRFTTERIWKLERRALAVAAEMADGERALAGEIAAARVIAARPSLKADQRRIAERLLTGGEGLVVVIGEAGTGKTYAVTAAASAWDEAGTELRVAAPTWRAANVLRSEGLDATSVARLLAELDGAAERGRPGLRQGSVLLVDEAGMVDSATLARLIDHAQAAEAKLVLIGDPAQLGEIEAGGLFAAIAQRHDAIVLDEVIRHRHELDREAAKLIREGEGAAALAAYRANERVTIATDRDGLREQMVSDWLRSYREGEDALMIAKRNSEVAELNARARAALRAEGRLGGAEIEVGGERFAAGDQVITRVNDHAAQIYNRERWRVAEVDVEARAVVLDGIDTRRRVCVDSVYLREVNERDGSPALQHGYAATTYQAQGATVDRAFVMADPSMDRQEFYVAASRSREESYFYASPEISLDREEFAPASRGQAAGLDHIAAAAERNGGQLAAHDEALRSRFSPLSTQDLHRLRREAAAEAHAEVQVERSREELTERIADQDRLLESTIGQTEGLPRLSREWRERERARIAELADNSAERANQLEAEREALPAPEFQGRAEVAVIEHLIAEREHAALLAAQIAPPPYITAELGERPTDWRKRREWDGAVREIESYRQQHGIRDRDTAFGPQPKDENAQREQRWARESLERSRRQLGIAQDRTRAVERSRSLGIEM